jgi:hypothetical protein
MAGYIGFKFLKNEDSLGEFLNFFQIRQTLIYISL